MTSRANNPNRPVDDMDYQATLETVLDSAMTPTQKYRHFTLQAIIVVVIGIVLYWTAVDTNVSATDVVLGIPAIADYVGRMYPPD